MLKIVGPVKAVNTTNQSIANKNKKKLKKNLTTSENYVILNT